MRTKLKRLIRETDQLLPLFTISRIASPIIVEMFAIAGGYRGFWMDQEHATLTTDQMHMLSITAQAHQMDCFVRIPPTGYAQVTQCLESGAGGVMAAQIRSADQAAEFASWCKFAPEGTRGMNTSGRDADFTAKSPAEFAVSTNDDVLVGIQVETPGAVTDVDKIAKLEQVDMLFVGPSDLSLSMGIVGQFDHPKLWEAIEAVAAACRRHGKVWACVAPNSEFAQRAIEMGCRLPTIGNELHVIRRGIGWHKDSFTQVFG